MKFYVSMKRNVSVPEEDALEYALHRCGYSRQEDGSFSREDQKEFVENFGTDIIDWFFSGNWLEVEAEDEEEAKEVFHRKRGGIE